MTLDIETLRALALKATPGPWRTQPDGGGMTEVYSDELHRDGMNVGIADDLRDYDAAFIAAAHPQAVLALLDRIAALEAGLSESLGLLATTRKYWTSRGVSAIARGGSSEVQEHPSQMPEGWFGTVDGRVYCPTCKIAVRQRSSR